MEKNTKEHTNFEQEQITKITGNIISEVNSNTVKKEQNEFEMHNFLLSYRVGEDKNVVKVSCSDKTLEKLGISKDDLKFGNFIAVKGNFSQHEYNGKVYSQLKMREYKLLKEATPKKEEKETAQKKEKKISAQKKKAAFEI